MNNSLEQMKEKFDQLPEDAKTAIRDFEYDKALKEIHSAYKLHIDQAYSLEKAVADTIFGELGADQLVPFLQKELRLGDVQAHQLGIDINVKILRPIQDKMREIQAQA